MNTSTEALFPESLLPNPSLLNDARVWRARDAQTRDPQRCVSTGFRELDAVLAGGGWPLGALSEILFPAPGIGELRLLMPALARLSQQKRWLAWIAPPYVPYAPALAAQGVNLSRVLVVHPRDEREALWAVEQALRSGTCGAVLAWVKHADERSLRRLQLAAEEGQSAGFLFRTQFSVVRTSPAALRLRIEPTAQGLSLQILKRRGGWPLAPMTLTFPTASHATAASRTARHAR